MRALAAIFSALALVAALTGCANDPITAGKCLLDSRCNPYPDTAHNPVVEWNSSQNST